MTMNANRPRNDGRRGGKPFRLLRGFSLPEVAIAIGIAGTALLALVGLIPALSDTDRSNGLNSMVPQMTTRALAEMRSMSTSELAANNSFTFYFTENGDLLQSSTNEEAPPLFKCVAELKEIPHQGAAENPADGGVPELNGNTCVVKMEFFLEHEAKGKTQVVYAGLRR